MNVIAWLERNAPGFCDLSEDERNAIMQFSLLWSLFEARALNTHGNVKAIIGATKQWATKGLLVDGEFEQQLSYFQSRYYATGAFTDNYSHLKLCEVGRELVERVLKDEPESLDDVVAALLLIVYRFRNNLLHGVKWAYDLGDQLENFTHANSILMKAIDLHDLSAAGT